MSMNQTAIDLTQVLVTNFPFIMLISWLVFFVLDCRKRESSSSIEVCLTEEDGELEDQELEIKENRICGYCGKELLFDETICSYCGAPRKT